MVAPVPPPEAEGPGPADPSAVGAAAGGGPEPGEPAPGGAEPAPAGHEQERPGGGSATGGAALRYGNPWQEGADQRDRTRQARGRMPSPITIWLAYLSPPERGKATVTGLTISSVMVAQGEPPLLVGLIPPLSDLAEVISVAGATFTVLVLGEGQQKYARHFSGEPAFPQGELAFQPSSSGPLLPGIANWFGCRSLSCRELGWSLLVEAEISEVHTGATGTGLAWYRGSFARVITGPR